MLTWTEKQILMSIDNETVINKAAETGSPFPIYNKKMSNCCFFLFIFFHMEIKWAGLWSYSGPVTTYISHPHQHLTSTWH